MGPIEAKTSSRATGLSLQQRLVGPSLLLICIVIGGLAFPLPSRTTLLAALVALFASCLNAWFIARSLTRRVRRISNAATDLATGNLERAPIADPTSDEIGGLSRDFDTMRAGVRDRIAEMNLRSTREEARLEGLVVARTKELAERNAALRLLLDTTDQGFLSLDLTGCVVGERSNAVDEYFGSLPEGASFGACLGALVPGFRNTFQHAFCQVVEDLLPLELTLDQLPKTLQLDDRHLALAYRPLFDDEKRLRRVLVIVSDVTPHELRRLAQQDEQEFTHLFAKALDDRAGVAAFLQDSQRLIGVISRESELTRTQFKQAVHALRGSSAAYGVMTMARTCHAIELALSERRELGPLVTELCARWQQISRKVSPLAADTNAFYVDAVDHAKLLQALHDGAPRADLSRMLEDWKVPLLAVQLERLAHQARSLAERLGKAPVTISVDAENLRLDPDRYPGFWPAFTHAVENAVDHGLEASEERELAGKPAMNRICLRAFTRPGEICIEIEDSGRGVDWALVRERARLHGIPARTQSDLVEALFQDDLGALRETCNRFGGSVELWSVTGSGTRVRCSLSTEALETPRLSLACG